MTIAVGVLGIGGAVIAADREETYGGFAKVDQQKVRGISYLTKKNLNFPLIVGSGFGIYADAFVQHLDRRFKEEAANGTPDPRSVLQSALKEFYQDHVQPFAGYPIDQRPDFEVIVAHPEDTHNRLFQTSYNVVYEPERYAVIGCGVTAARAILDPLVKRGGFSVEEAALAAMYAVFKAKETVPGCGKQTDLLIVRGRELHRLVDGGEDRIDALLRKVNDQLEPAMFQAAIGRYDPERVSKAVEKVRDQFQVLRQELGLVESKT